MEPNQGIKAWQRFVTVIVIIILIVLGYYLFKGDNLPSPAVTETTDTTQDEPADVNEVNRIVISDQYPGNIVYVSSVQLANGGWVAIHKDNAGMPGAIIGSAYFEKGINPGRITLTETTVDGKIYYAMIHSDDGDKKFDTVKDLPTKDSRGNIIMKLFRISTNITEVKG